MVHAVPQAVAAGESIGDEALIIATAVKLARVSLKTGAKILLVAILCLVGSSNQHRRGRGDGVPCSLLCSRICDGLRLSSSDDVGRCLNP